MLPFSLSEYHLSSLYVKYQRTKSPCAIFRTGALSKLLFLLKLLRSGVLDRGLGGGEAGDGHAERAAGDVVLKNFSKSHS